MKGSLRHLLILITVAVSAIEALAQTTPVNATLQLTPPYSVYLADYAVPGSEQMKLHVLLRDLSEPSYNVRLHLTVEGAGIRIETNPSFNPPPIVLEGGVPSILSAETLAPYLDSRNLLFSGITRQQYEQRAALPEGFYRFCFRVLDYQRRDVELSRETCTNAWFVLNDPPRINAPQCGSIIPLRDPQNVFFQWLPMNTGSPNSALTTEYEFTLVEIRPPGRNPNDAINTSVSIYQVTTRETSLLYGLTEPPLIPGQEYAFRVRAKDVDGRDLFKNQGYSAVCTFKFGEGNLLTPPEQVNVYAETERRAKVTWYLSLETDRYRVEYRKKNASASQENAWFSRETIEDYTLLNDLEPNTDYEVRVAGILRNFTSRYTEPKTFRTPEPRVFACGESPALVTSQNTKPLVNAMVGQRWKIGQFEMQVESVMGGNGVYTGIGAVIVPYLGFKIYSRFEKIWVNENQEVIQGEAVALSEDWQTFKDRWKPEDPTPEDTDAVTNADQSNQVPAFVDVPFEGEIDTVFMSSNGDIVVVDTQGNETTIQQPVNAQTGEKENTRIEDKNGDQWVVQKDAATGETKVSKVEGGGLQPGTTTAQSEKNAIKEKILRLILADFKSEISAWLQDHGKGPLDDETLALIMALPECFPQDADILQHINENTIPYYENEGNTSELREKIETNQTNKELFDKVAGLFSSISAVDITTLSEEHTEDTRNATCNALMEEASAIYYDKARMLKFLSTLRANNEKYAKSTDPGTGAYLTNNVVTDQDLKDQKIIDFMSSLSIYKLSSPTDPVIEGFLALINMNPDDEWVKLIEEKPTPVTHDESPILLARMMDVEVDTKENFTLSMNGYSLGNKSITLYAHESAGSDGVKLTFFNALIAPSGEKNAADEKNVINIRKAFDITVHSKNVEAFKNYIKLRGTINIIEEKPESEEIIIDVVRKRSNNYITISELSIRGTNIKGAALELGKGTEAESKATCSDYRADCYECKRVPAGEFAFVINTETTQQGQHKYKTLRLLNTTVNGSQRDGILIHMGDAHSWTQGCLLAMFDNEIEEIIQDDSKIFSTVMGYRKNIDERNAGRAFILSIIEFIEEKEKRMGKSLNKKVVIKNDPAEQTLGVSTSDFDLMQKANRYYYSNKLYDKAVEQFTIFSTNLQEKTIKDKLQVELAKYTKTLTPTLTKESYKESEVRALYEKQWDDLYAKHAGTITLAGLQNEAVVNAKDFTEVLKANFSAFITDKDILEILFHSSLTTLLHEKVTKVPVSENDKTGFRAFVSQNYSQKLYDKTLTDTKSKLIEAEIVKVTKAIGE